MGDELEPTQASAPTTDGSTGQEPALPELDRATLLELLDKHTDDPEFRQELRRRRVIGSLAGDIAQQQREQERFQAAAEAVTAEKQRLKDLYENDRMAFAEEIKTKLDVEEERREKAGLRDLTRREFGEKIGNALREFPEFNELTADDVQDLSKTLAGVPEDDVITVFTKKATDIVATKRAQKLAEGSLKERLAAERKVWEAEQAEKRVKERRAPTVRQPSAGNAQDDGEPADFYSPEWRAWDENQRKNGRGIYAAARR